MQEVEAYRSKNELTSVIDNGGRFYNVFSRANDQVVTKGELAKAAGMWASDLNAFLFLDLATFDLDEMEKLAVEDTLEPDLRNRYRQASTRVIAASDIDGEGQAGDAIIVEGSVQKCHEKTKFSGYIYVPITVGDVTTFTVTPIFDHFSVYRLFDGDSRKVDAELPGAVVAVPLKAEFSAGDRIRFAGYLRELEFDDEESRTNNLYLEAIYFSRLQK